MRELEFKFKLAAEDAAALAAGGFAGAEAPRVIRMQAVYYDTAEGHLAAEHIAFRERRENENRVATLKCGGRASGALHEREEHEMPADGETADCFFTLLEKSSCAALSPLFRETLKRCPLLPVAATDYRRVLFTVRRGASVMELCVDEGELIGGTRHEAFCELELELKEGSGEALQAFAEELKRQYTLTPEPLSKYARARALYR